MHKVVKLSVHKNNLNQRKTKEFRTKAIDNFKRGINNKDVVGYAYISWDKEGAISSAYDLKDDSPYSVYNIPEIAKLVLTGRLIG